MNKIPDDKVIILGGRVAGTVLTAYSQYYLNHHPDLDLATSKEHFLFEVARLSGLRWRLIRRDRLPYFTVLHLQRMGKSPILCIRGITAEVLWNPRGECP